MTFLAIAGGILLGLGSAAVTIFNGGFVGALVGLTIENGRVGDLLRLDAPARAARAVAASRSAASAGLRIGWALIEPRHADARRRRCAREARPAMEIVLGTMPWLVLAGLSRAS